MIALGIESTAHTIGVGIVEGKRVLANVRRMYKPPSGQGILPRLAADHHATHLAPAIGEALSAAGISGREVDLFSFSKGPGIGQCLRVSCCAAKYLAARHKKPILGVNHCQAHLEICKWQLSLSDPLFVYVSGANTQLIVENKKAKKRQPRFSVIGETLDMGLGNLFDVFAREAEFAYPHGSEVARMAEKGRFFPLPYTVKGMNFAFAGLLTSAVRSLREHPAEDVCHSLTETAFAEICEASERALCLTEKREVTVCGGVAQNARFCGMLSSMCRHHGARFCTVAPEFNADNGAMIACAALSEFGRGKRDALLGLSPDGYWRIDQVC